MDKISNINGFADSLLIAENAGKTIRLLSFLKVTTAVVSFLYVVWSVLFRLFNDEVQKQV